MILICIYKLLYIATQSCMNKNGTHTQVLFKDHTSSDVVHVVSSFVFMISRAIFFEWVFIVFTTKI